MKKNLFLRTVAVILVFVILLPGCASTTMFQSVPSGAKLYMNGEYVGKTPYTYSDTKIVGTTTTIRLTAEGYSDFNGVLKRNEEANVGAIIGGVFLLFPFLWVMDYKPVHNFELTPVSAEK